MKKKSTANDIRLEAMAIEIPDFPGHPNRVPFSGVLTRLDAPSDRAPSGAAGHRVLLTRAAAERALPSLLGMAVDYAPGLRSHDVRRKIGVITRAEIIGDRLEVAGHFFGKDFPDLLNEIRAQRERLGMSYEVTGVRVRFDYRLRDGPATTRNAIRVLEAHGYPEEITSEARERAGSG